MHAALEMIQIYMHLAWDSNPSTQNTQQPLIKSQRFLTEKSYPIFPYPLQPKRNNRELFRLPQPNPSIPLLSIMIHSNIFRTARVVFLQDFVVV
jgi:hypothetical protein